MDILNWGEHALGWFLPDLSLVQWTGHLFVLFWSLVLVALSPKLFAMLEETQETNLNVRLFRFCNYVVILLLILDLLLLRLRLDYEQALANIGLSFFTCYTGIYLYSLASYFSFRRFGKLKTIDSKEIYVETYSTRIVNLLLVALIVLTSLYIVIKVWGADSLLQTTGIMGIFVGFLAFTSGLWAPDIIAGLTILNSQFLEDGDLVVIDGYPNEYIINKVSFVYLTLYDVRNNHRTLIRNSRFLQSKIDNLSRIASTDGLRRGLSYKIGYPDCSGKDADARNKKLEQFLKRIDRMFEAAFETCKNDEETKINRKKPFEWALTKTGDYALEFTLWYNFERPPNTRVTSSARKYTSGTEYRVNQAVYRASVAEGIELATPALMTLDSQTSGATERA